VETACYRVLQEAVTNAIRHARARRIEVVMDADGPELTLEVRDDGCGFDADGRPAGLGLLGMRERAELTGGQLDITSRPGEGTTVRACFPLGATGRA
jgi:signal transduction histidine kinase